MERLRGIHQDIKALSIGIRSEIYDEADRRVRLLNLYEYPWARRAVDVYYRQIKVEPIPESLAEEKKAVLVSNYFSVGWMTIAVLKAACCFPGKEGRFRAIARKEIKARANLLLKALGVDRMIYSAYKDESGVYKLDKETTRKVLNFLKEPGHILWMSVTGKTEGNGLLEKDIRIGAAYFSSTSQAPLVPMGIKTVEIKGKRRAKEVVFGEPFTVPSTKGLSDVDRSELLMDCTRLAMCRIAELLPPGQRGDFEDVDGKLEEMKARLESYLPK